jgi:hypothetical protein
VLQQPISLEGVYGYHFTFPGLAEVMEIHQNQVARKVSRKNVNSVLHKA